MASARLKATRSGMLIPVSPARTARPPASSTSPGFAPHSAATAACTCAFSLRAASMHALPSMNVTRDEYAPRSTGVKSVSPASTRIWSSGTPSSSATMYVTIESTPWPISDAPEKTATRPERSICSWIPDWGMSLG